MAREFGEVCCDRKARAVYWFIGCTVDGTRYKLRGYRTVKGRLLRFPNEKAAKEALDEIRSDLRHGMDPLQAISEFLPFGAPKTLFEHHYKIFCKAKATDQSVPLSRQRIVELWGHLSRGYLDEIKELPVQALGYADLEDWVQALFARTELSANSIHHVVADVRTFFRWLARRGEIRSAPEVPTVRVPEYVPDVPTASVQERVLETIPWPLRGVFMARGLMGLRPSEARNADLADYWFDPDGNRDVLTVRKSKSNRYRLIPVPSPVSAWVHEHHQASNLRDANAPAVPLFGNPNGIEVGRWSGSAERRVLIKAMKACAVKHKPNELLRHAFGTDAANRLLAEGSGQADVSRLIMAIMGHSEVKTSARYIRLATEGLERIVVRNCPQGVPKPK
jgi:site-specific recombinase XerD